jgi:predicted RNase H-like nuclease
MSSSKQGELPYKTVAGVIPCEAGWLLVAAKIKGATFAPDFPRAYEDLDDIISHRPPYAMVGLNAPVSDLDGALDGTRPCDVEAESILGRTVGETRWGDEKPVIGDDSLTGRTAILAERYRELRELMAPFLQRTICEMLPELSFYQLNAEILLTTPPRTEEGYEERRGLLGKVPGIVRILEHQMEGVDRFDLLEGAALMWSARRVAARAGRRVPSRDPAWDASGLRIEILR